MMEGIIANPRQRQLLVSCFLVGSSVAAGWSIYNGKLKILAFLGLLTAGVFLRQASFANAYLLTLVTSSLALIRYTPIKAEFNKDKWIALIAMGVLSCAVAAFSIRRPAWPKPIHGAVLALVAVSAWSFSWSVMPTLSFSKAGTFAVVLLIAFVGVWSWARSIAQVRRIVDVHLDNLWVVWPVAFASLLILGGGGYVAGRFYAIFSNPNNLGYWGSATIPLLFACMLTHPARWRRITCGAMLCFASICVVLAGSRGGMLGAAIGCSVYCLLRFPRPMVFAGVVSVVSLVFLHLYGVRFELPESLQQIIRPDTIDDLSDRRVWWPIAILICQQRPLLGHGFGLTDLLFTHYGLDVGTGETFGATVHNSYLEAAMNIGTIGLGLVVLIQTWTTLTALRAWRRDRDGELGLLSLALMCVLIAGSAHAVVESTLFAAGNPWSLPFWVSAALIHRLAAIQSAAPARPPAAAALATVPASAPA